VSPESILPGVGASTDTTQQLAGEALFESLHDHGWIGALRFRQQEMNVFRHDHVSDDDETVAAAGLLENLQEKIAIAGRAEKGEGAGNNSW